MAQPSAEDTWRLTFRELLSPIEDIIDEARNGRMFILVDDEDRENEGDLVIPAQMAGPEAINFMAMYGRGLICLAMTQHQIEHLELPMMSRKNETRHETAFTVSIEAREGVTTGISAPDRARTISVAIDPNCDPKDIVTPGHVFPLMARDGGVLERTGHTEAAVDLARLAGLNPAGVICEIMNDDGTMARRDDLIAFAQRHSLKIATIADLIAYRRRNEKLLDAIQDGELESHHGGKFQMRLYRNKTSGAEHVALWKGQIDDGEPVAVRVHALNLFDDVLGDKSRRRGGELQAAMQMIGEMERGLVIVIRDPSALSLGQEFKDKAHGRPSEVLRDYGEGAHIMLDLGVSKMILLHNTRHDIVGLEGYGLEVVGQRPVEVSPKS